MSQPELKRRVWPRTYNGEQRERRQRRLREIDLVLRALHKVRFAEMHGGGRPLNVLEIGTGNGFQLPGLRSLGRVIGSDYARDPLLELRGETFVICDVSRAPFRTGSFDLVFSNHVLQAVQRLDDALREMRRLCSSLGLVVAVVPTSLWIWLSIPYQYLDRMQRFAGRMFGRSGSSPIPAARGSGAIGENGRARSSRLLPRGTGRYAGFWETHSAFRAPAWRRLFFAAGLRVIYEEGLLLYGPSQWPVVPTNRLCARIGISSSRLFILKPDPAP